MIYFIIAIQAVIVVGAVVTVVRLVRRRRVGLNTAEALGVPSMPRAMLRMLLIGMDGLSNYAGSAFVLPNRSGLRSGISVDETYLVDHYLTLMIAAKNRFCAIGHAWGPENALDEVIKISRVLDL